MWYRIAIFFVRLARTGEFSLPGIGNYINYTLTVDKFKNPALIFKKLGWVKKNPHTKLVWGRCCGSGKRLFLVCLSASVLASDLFESFAVPALAVMTTSFARSVLSRRLVWRGELGRERSVEIRIR
ncbi:MAG: hypothetical protein UU22_C0025G0003 [Parcubacteria group bacterium GW2011_GWA2_40_8]|nr:MAG: hypothetical protein UT82_C0009G0017 [Parcubacteria group bacterium GW2011_GWB1_40_14]KKR78421.1 MAG: hypothetical protein UU22_C0025G0003 [Parcubacteria group bacterium GW2011_GWA2_40_8]